jgi:gliding motility-associated-like protein
MVWTRITYCILFLLFFAFPSKAIDTPVTIFQVCLNSQDSIVTIKWKTSPPTCPSFVKYQIYGREDESSVYALQTEIFNQSTQEYSGKLPNTKTWDFYVATLYACNGDTLFSNPFKVDKTEPIAWEMDSVSIDLVTQRARIGWKGHPAIDNEGYVVYHVANNNTAIFTGQGFSFLDTIKGEPFLQPENYALASYDSCGNFSPISKGHTSVFLEGKYDTCGRTISLQFTEYQGLNPSKYEILSANDSLLGFTTISRTDSLQLNHVISDLIAGKQYCFFVRFYSDNGITASSNRICIETPPVIGDTLHLFYATVNESKEVALSFFSALSEGTLRLHRKDSFETRLISSFTLDTSRAPLFYFDKEADTDKQSYSYFLTHTDKCGNPILTDTSNIASTLFLQIEEDAFGSTLTWTPYKDFANPVSIYEVYKHFGTTFVPRGTWSLFDLLNAGQLQSFDVYQQQEYAYKLCYCVRAIEQENNIFGRTDTAYSNSVCFKRELAIFFPNAFAPNGVNERFKPIGIGINLESTRNLLEIYNRWGQKIYTTQNITEGWDGYYNNQLSPAGTYLYKATVEGDQGELVQFKGTLILLN